MDFRLDVPRDKVHTTAAFLPLNDLHRCASFVCEARNCMLAAIRVGYPIHRNRRPRRARVPDASRNLRAREMRRGAVIMSVRSNKPGRSAEVRRTYERTWCFQRGWPRWDSRDSVGPPSFPRHRCRHRRRRPRRAVGRRTTWKRT